MHAWWDILGLPSLISSHKVSIEDFEYECAKIVCIYGRYGMSFNISPARLHKFRGGVSPSFRNKASIVLADCQSAPISRMVFTHTYMMASSSFMLLRTSNPPTFHSPLSLVYNEPTRSAPWTEEASSLMNLIVCCQIFCQTRPPTMLSQSRTYCDAK